MPAIQSPYFNINYGWVYGEDGWNTGMDENLLRSSFLMRNAVTEITSSLPPSPPDGYSCILTTDSLAYFRVEGNYVFVEIEEGYELTTLADGKRWRKESSGYVEIPTASGLNARVGSLEGRVDTAEGNIFSLQAEVDGIRGSVGGIVGDASGLPVTSESQTMSLTEWMAYVRNRANHTGTQQASTISDFEEAVITRMSQSVGSSTLEIEYDADQEVIFFDNPQGRASEVQSVDGVLQVTSEGGAVVPLTEDVTEVLLPVGEFFTTKVLSIAFVQDSTTPYAVSGWPSDVEWVGGTAPVINPELDSQALITLVNVDNRGWMGSSSGSFDTVGSAAQALTDAKDYTDQALQSPVPVVVDEEVNIPINCFFVDSVDDVLKFKDVQGIVHVVSLVP